MGLAPHPHLECRGPRKSRAITLLTLRAYKKSENLPTYSGREMSLLRNVFMWRTLDWYTDGKQQSRWYVSTRRCPHEYWHLHRSDCKSQIHAHTTSRNLLTCDISLGSLTVATLEAGDFVELLKPCSKLSGIHDPISYGGRFGKLKAF